MDNAKKEEINTIIDNFWLNDVWTINTNNIYNKKIVNIINEINRLQDLLDDSDESNKYILDGSNFDINNNSDIIEKINKLKKDNINYIKIHSNSIPEYHILVSNIKLNYIPNTYFSNFLQP